MSLPMARTMKLRLTIDNRVHFISAIQAVLRRAIAAGGAHVLHELETLEKDVHT